MKAYVQFYCLIYVNKSIILVLVVNVLAELMKGYKAAEFNTEEDLRNERSLLAQCQAVADMKFTYVVSCQQYGIQKRSRDARAQDILRLMTTYSILVLV